MKTSYKKHSKAKTISVLLFTFFLLLGMLPVSALADEGQAALCEHMHDDTCPQGEGCGHVAAACVPGAECKAEYEPVQQAPEVLPVPPVLNPCTHTHDDTCPQGEGCGHVAAACVPGAECKTEDEPVQQAPEVLPVPPVLNPCAHTHDDTCPQGEGCGHVASACVPGAECEAAPQEALFAPALAFDTEVLVSNWAGLAAAVARANSGEEIAIVLQGNISMESVLLVTDSLMLRSENGGGFSLSAKAGERHFTINTGVKAKDFTLDFTGVTLHGGAVGGGLLATGGHSISYEGGTITACTAAQGGGVYVNAGTSFIMLGGSITGNTATSGGGLYVCEQSILETYAGANISANTATSGGGIYLNAGYAKIYGGSVSTNTAAQEGGGVFAANYSSLLLQGGEIKQNAVPASGTAGGGVYTKSSQLSISGGQIAGNTAPKGAGVYVQSTGAQPVDMNGGAIIGNDATIGTTGEGGGVHLSAGVFNMTGGQIGGNAGDANKGKNGGGVHIYAGTFNLSGTALIAGNTAGNGGGVYISGAAGTLNLSGGSIGKALGFTMGNTAGNGGGVYAAAGSVNITGGYVYGNQAENGGGIYTLSAAVLSVGNAGIVNNTASQKGGGVHASGSFVLNSGGIIGSAQNLINTAQNGGGVYVQGNASFTMQPGSSILGNYASQNGGGVYVHGAASFTMNGGSIKNNSLPSSQDHHGGGIYALGSSVSILAGEVTENAAYHGGGIYTTSYSSLAVSAAAKVINNTAHAGVIVMDPSVDTINAAIYTAKIKLPATNYSAGTANAYNNRDINYTKLVLIFMHKAGETAYGSILGAAGSPPTARLLAEHGDTWAWVTEDETPPDVTAGASHSFVGWALAGQNAAVANSQVFNAHTTFEALFAPKSLLGISLAHTVVNLNTNSAKPSDIPYSSFSQAALLSYVNPAITGAVGSTSTATNFASVALSSGNWRPGKPAASYTVQLTVTDSASNSASVNITVNVLDDTAPGISATQNRLYVRQDTSGATTAASVLSAFGIQYSDDYSTPATLAANSATLFAPGWDGAKTLGSYSAKLSTHDDVGNSQSKALQVLVFQETLLVDNIILYTSDVLRYNNSVETYLELIVRTATYSEGNAPQPIAHNQLNIPNINNIVAAPGSYQVSAIAPMGTSASATITVLQDIYAVTFVYNNGLPNTMRNYSQGDAIAQPGGVTRAGYTLTGWSNVTQGGTWNFSTGRMPAQSIVLSANWQYNGNPDVSEPGPPPTVLPPVAPLGGGGGAIVLPQLTAPGTATPATGNTTAPPAQQLETLPPNPAPLGGLPQQNKVWGLLNLVISVFAIVCIVLQLRKAKSKKYNKDGAARKIMMAFSLVFGVAIPLLFILGSDFTAKMALVDWLSLPLAIMFVAQAVSLSFSAKKEKQQAEETPV